MPLGDSRFPQVLTDFDQLLAMHGITVTLTRFDDSKIGERDIHGQPTKDIYGNPYVPDTISVDILIADEYLDEDDIIAGSKPKVILQFMAKPGVVIEHDEFSYLSDAHIFKVESVSQSVLGGDKTLELCQATREVLV